VNGKITVLRLAVVIAVVFSSVAFAERALRVPDRVLRDPNSLLQPRHYNDGLKYGFTLAADGLLAKVPYSSAGSSGVGFGIGLETRLPIARNWHVTVSTAYRKLNLSRTLDGSGALDDSNPTSFSQSLGCAAIGGLVGTRLDVKAENDLEWWVEGGAEVLYPVSATQSTSIGDSVSFKSSDRFLFLLLGPSAAWSLGGKTELGLHLSLKFFYNTTSGSGSSLYGARLGVAIHLRV